MKQFILSAPPDPDGFVRISGRDFHYLSHVKRLRRGSFFPALLPGGTPARVRVVSVGDEVLTGECLLSPALPAEESRAPVLPPVVLFQALPKGARMDLIIRQAAEGGIAEVVPFMSAHSVPRPNGSGGRLERWRRIIREARQQSGSGAATEVREPVGFDALLEYWEALRQKYERPRGLLLHQVPLEKGSFHEYLDKQPDLVVLAVGPEGGFSPEEVSRATALGFKPLTMGDTVLRTETAALYASAAIRIILLESASWMSNISR
jgi:16S rRNA (uracil1498-N3)-methyltransferase